MWHKKSRLENLVSQPCPSACAYVARSADQGIAVSRPILIGSTATLLTPAEKLSVPPDHTHKWTIAVRSAASLPLPPLPTAEEREAATASASSTIGTRMRDSELDVHRAVGGRDDLSYFIKRVQFRLHDTYAQPTRSTHTC